LKSHCSGIVIVEFHEGNRTVDDYCEIGYDFVNLVCNIAFELVFRVNIDFFIPLNILDIFWLEFIPYYRIIGVKITFF